MILTFSPRSVCPPALPLPTAALGFPSPSLSHYAREDYDVAMGKLFEQIRPAVDADRFFVAWHADERCEERGITAWQLIAGLAEAELVRERPRSKPNPSVVVRQILEDGREVEVICPGSARPVRVNWSQFILWNKENERTTRKTETLGSSRRIRH
jgi:hypothetical protein